MVFPTIEFAAFFLAVLCLSWLLMPRPALWKPFVLGASYFFYGFADARFVLLIIASTLINQAAARLLSRWRDRRILVVAVAANLAILGWFKYYGFFALSVDRALDDVGLGAPLPLLQVALPIGISFFTFQALSYVIDVYREGIAPASLVDFAVYEAFFPHLVAGPIVRASEFLPQLASPRDASQVPLTRAVFLISGGLFKKIVLADLLATELVDPVFNTPGQHSSLEILVAVYGYAVQIYCDFSAYSDMAIGIALLMGFKFPDNFDRPYSSASLQEFWRRWHMTLSRWLRDYVYVSLGGNRHGVRRTYINLMATMTLGGLWHGAAWTFVIWGALHGAGLATERRLAERRQTERRHGDGRSPAGLVPGPGAAPVIPLNRTGTTVPPGTVPPGTVPPGAVPPGAVPPATVPPATATSMPAPRHEPPLPAMASAASTTSTGTAASTGIGSDPDAATVTRARTSLPSIPQVGDRPSAARTWVGRLIVFHFVCATWVLFRSPDLTTAIDIFVRMFTAPGPAPLVTVKVLLAIAAGLATQAVPKHRWHRLQDAFASLRPPWQVATLTAFVVTIYAFVGHQDVAPFIYFRF